MRRAAWVLVVAICMCFVSPARAPAGKSGIWKAEDQTYNFYIQTYDTGSCVVIGTADGGEFYVFLEPNCAGNITTQEYFGKPAGIELSYLGEDTALVDLKIDGNVTDYTIEKVFEGDCRNGGPPEDTFTNSLGMTFVYIRPGMFTMGSPESELYRYENETQHLVTLTQGFYMQTTEVTQGQWEAVMETNPSHFDTCGDDCPVEMVSWEDVQAFITQLNSMGEGTYRLPTEAEWEYAARAGSAMAFGNGGITKTHCLRDPNLWEMGWYCNNSGETTHPVGRKSPNAWGLYDMHGNVWEWCQDWYGDYPGGPETDPEGPDSGSWRVIRGASWNSYAEHCRSGLRTYETPGYPNNARGFRVARDAP